MCHSDSSRPPLPPVGGAASGEAAVELTSADGTRVMAYAARADKPSGRGMVVLPDVRGLHEFYRDLVRRLAEAGIDAIAIDYFGRTASDTNRDESFDWRSQIGQVDAIHVATDVAAAVDYLRSPAGGAAAAVFTMGFCFGGRESWRQSAMQTGLSGCIGFYGGQPSSLVEVSARMQAPLLMLLAGEDFNPPEGFRELEAALSENGVDYVSRTYAGAPHSFFDRGFAEHAEACADAWRMLLTFTAERTPGTQGTQSGGAGSL